MKTTTMHEHDVERITDLLLGRRIVFAAMDRINFHSTNPHGYRYREYAEGVLTLDDGTVIYVRGNEGCACPSGNYDLTHLATVDNIITSVRLDDVATDDGEDYHIYRIFVVADAEEINVLEVEGDDGNGYYGTGYELLVCTGEGKDVSE